MDFCLSFENNFQEIEFETSFYILENSFCIISIWLTFKKKFQNIEKKMEYYFIFLRQKLDGRVYIKKKKTNRKIKHQ